MQFTKMIVAAFATLAVAAPTSPAVEERSILDVSGFNGLNFFNNDISYLLGSVNSVDLVLLQTLVQQNNLNINAFSGLFNGFSGVNQFDIQSLIAAVQLNQLLQFGQVGLFNGIDLSTLPIGFNSGLFSDSLLGLNLSPFIDQSIIPTVTQIVQSQTAVQIIGKKE